MSHTEFSLPLLKIIHCKCIIAHTLNKHITPELAKGQTGSNSVYTYSLKKSANTEYGLFRKYVLKKYPQSLLVKMWGSIDNMDDID